MKKYAREDTHYLLNIYDKLRDDIVKKALEKKAFPETYLRSVLNSSKEITLRTYQKPQTKNEGYYAALSRFQQASSKQKVSVFKNLWKWRENLGRLLDENPRYILPQNLFIKLIEDQPKTVTQLLKNFKNLHSAIHSNAEALVEILNTKVADEQEDQKERSSEQKDQRSLGRKEYTGSNQSVKFSVEVREPSPVKEFITDRVFQLIDFPTTIQKTSQQAKEKTDIGFASVRNWFFE